MNIKGKKVLVIGGAGFIGSAVVRKLLETDVESVCIYDNFTRGNTDNIADSLRDPRCKIFSHGGDIRDLDILDAAMKGVDYVFHLAAMWLLHCKDYPRTAFEVNIAGTFNVLEACVKHGVKKLIYSSSASVSFIFLAINRQKPLEINVSLTIRVNFVDHVLQFGFCWVLTQRSHNRS